MRLFLFTTTIALLYLYSPFPLSLSFPSPSSAKLPHRWYGVYSFAFTPRNFSDQRGVYSFAITRNVCTLPHGWRENYRGCWSHDYRQGHSGWRLTSSLFKNSCNLSHVMTPAKWRKGRPLAAAALTATTLTVAQLLRFQYAFQQSIKASTDWSVWLQRQRTSAYIYSFHKTRTARPP